MGVIIMVHLLSVSQYQSIEVLDNFFDVVDGFVNRSKVHEIAGRVRVLGIIKDEGSTRTRVSFDCCGRGFKRPLCSAIA
jgi:ornithine carbamoyltransferase